MDLTSTAWLPRARRALLALLAAAWLAFGLITWLVVANPSGTSFDLWLAPDLFTAAETQAAVAALGRLIDVIGGDLVAGVLVLVVVVILIQGKRGLLAGYFAASAIGGVVLCTIVKGLVDRPRPSTVGVLLNEGTLSYPSGHATSGISVFVALGLVSLIALSPRVRWWVAVPLFVFGPLIGVSRVAMGVHWPTDVLGGWALGTAWTATVAFVVAGVAIARSR